MSAATEVISHWSTLIENFKMSPQKFYGELAASLKKRQIPDSKINRISLKEGNMLSARREYLQISCKRDFYFAICGAPFGTGFFVSWWLLQPPDGCLAQLFSSFPFLSAVGRAMVRPWTYYRIDTATMFQTSAHRAVLEVVDSITSENNIKALPDTDRKPVMKEFFRF